MNSQLVIEYIVAWLKDYATNAHMKGFVVGVSGGIDSAVVSTLCAKTGLEVLCLNMPIRQKIEQLERASHHINALRQKYPNVRSHLIDLTPTFEQFEYTVSGSLKKVNNIDLAMANTRSRLRMTALYFYAQINQLLVTGTGNKVEDFGVGFFTKYGDGGVDISPIADLLKTQIYEIAKKLDISQAIQSAAPTDGLWDSERTDEQQIGATYPELERAMAQFETGVTREGLSGRELEVFDIFIKLNRATQHKVTPIPVCKIPSEYLR